QPAQETQPDQRTSAGLRAVQPGRRHPHLSCESLARAWSVPASRHTVRRRLISAGFRSRADRGNSAPAGSAKFRAWCAARLKWARLRLHWRPEHWASWSALIALSTGETLSWSALIALSTGETLSWSALIALG
uniref:HTH_Tnp_Tc3_2 domain-containing protein n=1 Tax=Macrostomum lignano TaxID=282301 RepID=A0A1I8ILK9_9PLAT